MRSNQVVFALAPIEQGKPFTVILGVSRDAWIYMKDGQTHNFDLTKVGVPLQIVMFGAKTADDARAQITLVNRIKAGENVTAKDMNFDRSDAATDLLERVVADPSGVMVTPDLFPIVSELIMRQECIVTAGQSGELYVQLNEKK